MFQRFKLAWQLSKDLKQEEIKSLTPMATLPSYKNNKPIYKEWSVENSVREGYKSSTWVYSCVSRISKTAASVPWRVYQKTAQGLEEVIDHPLSLILDKPNPYMSGGDFIERIVAHLYLGGNAIFSKVRANNIVAELWPISPDSISPIPNDNEFISFYEYRRDGIIEQIPSNDIVHVMFVDPNNLYWGLAPLQAVARVVDTDNELINFQMLSLQNRAITDGVFSFKHPLTKQQWEEARQMVREQHMGTSGARTPWILGGDASWQQMSLSPAEMDFIDSRMFTREEICSVFNVPPPMIGLYENATLSNIETARKIFWLDTMIPLLEDIKSSLNLALAYEFGNDLVLDYDVSNVQALQDNYDEKVQTAERLWNMGIPFNQINQKLQLGFDEIEGGNIGYLPSNLFSIDSGNQNQGTAIRSVELGESKIDNAPGEEVKARYWKQFDAERENWMTYYEERLLKRFDEEAQYVADAYEDGFSLEDIFQSQEEQWTVLLSALNFGIIEQFGESTFENLKQAQFPQEQKAFNPWARHIVTWVKNKTAEKVKGIVDTTKDLIRNVIGVSIEEGLGTSQIARKIRERYKEFSTYRANRIARTETVSASNFGSYASAKQTGFNVQKVWVSARDERVRDSHNTMDGQRVGLDDYFYVNGDEMLHPGGGTIPEENINCRCVVLYE